MAIKTVELVWSGTHWCDRFTGVKIPEGIYPPPDQQAEMIGTTLEEWAGKGPPPDYHGSGSYLNEPSRSDNDALVALIENVARNVLAERTIPKFPAYFVGKDWLVTYDWHAADFHECMNRIRALESKLLERPWYKRWFS